MLPKSFNCALGECFNFSLTLQSWIFFNFSVFCHSPNIWLYFNKFEFLIHLGYIFMINEKYRMGKVYVYLDSHGDNFRQILNFSVIFSMRFSIIQTPVLKLHSRFYQNLVRFWGVVLHQNKITLRAFLLSIFLYF